MCIRDRSDTVKRNVKRAQDLIIAAGGSPSTDPWVVDCDSGHKSSNHMLNTSPCLTRSRYRGHWLLREGRRLSTTEMLRLQGFNPDRVAVAVSECTLGQQVGNAMSVNVVERILVKLLVPVGLLKKSCLKHAHDTVSYTHLRAHET